MNKMLVYFVLLLIQVILSQLIQPVQDWVLTILPVMMLCFPTDWSTLRCMLFAFFSALFVDFFSGGIIGLNVLALVPVAWSRNFFLRKFFNDELVDRGAALSMRKWGFPAVLGLIVLLTALFLLVYIVVDASDQRSLLLEGRTFLLSLVCDTVLALLVLPSILER